MEIHDMMIEQQLEQQHTNSMTFCLPVGDDSMWFAPGERPSHVTGELIFKLVQYGDDTWLHARFYYDPKLWDVNKHGMIYTDRVFIQDLHARLACNRGFKHATCIDYSESGMQGDNYVDLDVSDKIWPDLVRCGIKAVTRWPEYLTKQTKYEQTN